MPVFRRSTTRAQRIIKILLVAVILLTFSFIFGNSMLDAESSDRQSSAVTDTVVGVLPTDKKPADDVALGDFHYNLRKAAHFAEYGLLGFEIALYIAIFAVSIPKTALVSPFIGLTAAFTDETIQIFSGRGASVEDMWLDIFGFLTASLIVYIGCILVKIRPITRFLDKNRSRNNNG